MFRDFNYISPLHSLYGLAMLSILQKVYYGILIISWAYHISEAQFFIYFGNPPFLDIPV